MTDIIYGKAHAFDSPAQRVARGAEELDAVRPWWFELIDYDLLDISDGTACILGQAFGEEADNAGINSGYAYALGFIGNDSAPLAHLYSNIQAYGLCGNAQKGDDEKLREEWIEYIEARKAVHAR